MSENKSFLKTTSGASEYEPFMIGDKQAGEVHWLGTTNSSGEATYSGLWRCEPMTFDYEFPGDEYIHVLDGSLDVKTDTEIYQLNKGDIVLFHKGIKSVWTIKRSFKKFFVIDNCTG
ncbi:MAG: cupin domain-containing protein [Pseudomonadota bacterium]|jgi:hypothetical protein|nr:cupin domain-containing protein [Pseudomonadota bacterium]|tara:strand:- start:83 stop:433 length:351 start_codon:yes stop_codon:yes gene_type:complete